MKRLYRWKPLVPSHYAVEFGGFQHDDSRDTYNVSICYATMQDQLSKLSNFMSGSLSR